MANITSKQPFKKLAATQQNLGKTLNGLMGF